MPWVIDMRRETDKEMLKEALKEAGKEWLNEQFATFGKWTALGLLSALFYGAVKLTVALGWWPR